MWIGQSPFWSAGTINAGGLLDVSVRSPAEWLSDYHATTFLVCQNAYFLFIFSLLKTRKPDREIVAMLKKENINTSRQTVWRLKKHYQKYSTISALQRPGRPSKLRNVSNVIEACMKENDETTAKQLVTVLKANHGLDVSTTTVLRARRRLGWSYRGSAYCQLIRDINKTRRLDWAKNHLNDDFFDVVWTDETTIQLKTHKRYCCRRMEKSRDISPVQNTLWKCMYGEA